MTTQAERIHLHRLKTERLASERHLIQLMRFREFYRESLAEIKTTLRMRGEYLEALTAKQAEYERSLANVEEAIERMTAP